MNCKVKILKHLEGVFPEYQPTVGKVYNANYTPGKHHKNGCRNAEFCVVDILDKRIVLRSREFEIVED